LRSRHRYESPTLIPLLEGATKPITREHGYRLCPKDSSQTAEEGPGPPSCSCTVAHRDRATSVGGEVVHRILPYEFSRVARRNGERPIGPRIRHVESQMKMSDDVGSTSFEFSLRSRAALRLGPACAAPPSSLSNDNLDQFFPFAEEHMSAEDLDVLNVPFAGSTDSNPMEYFFSPHPARLSCLCSSPVAVIRMTRWDIASMAASAPCAGSKPPDSESLLDP